MEPRPAVTVQRAEWGRALGSQTRTGSSRTWREPNPNPNPNPSRRTSSTVARSQAQGHGEVDGSCREVALKNVLGSPEGRAPQEGVGLLSWAASPKRHGPGGLTDTYSFVVLENGGTESRCPRGPGRRRLQRGPAGSLQLGFCWCGALPVCTPASVLCWSLYNSVLLSYLCKDPVSKGHRSWRCFVESQLGPQLSWLEWAWKFGKGTVYCLRGAEDATGSGDLV